MTLISILVILGLFVPSGCVERRHHLHATKTPRTGVISHNETGTLVDTTWMLKYKLLESKHGTIPEDAQIYMEGEQYRIPQAVSHHSDDMKGARNSP